MGGVPHDNEAERALLSVAMLSGEARRLALGSIGPQHFYRPTHGLMFEAIEHLHGEGAAVTTISVMDVLRTNGLLETCGGSKAVMDIGSLTVAVSSAERLVEIIWNHAARRDLIAKADRLREAAELGDPAAVLAQHQEQLLSVDLPTAPADDVFDANEYVTMNRVEGKTAPWIIPGLIRQDWRVIVVATEGAGKTLLLQQLAIAASQGIHPLWPSRRFDPVTTLMIDTENPDERIADGAERILGVTKRLAGSYSGGAWIWSRGGGLDLRSPRDRKELEDRLAEHRPQLVCAGPAYKLATRGKNEGWDEVARAVQVVFDDLRKRYGFALVLEDHAPQGDARGHRELRPFGSSMWLRWPELGLGLRAIKDSRNFTVEHFRAARLKHSWPAELHRGDAHTFPFIGYWPDSADEITQGKPARPLRAVPDPTIGRT